VHVLETTPSQQEPRGCMEQPQHKASLVRRGRAISLRGVSKRFGSALILNGIQLDIRAGEFLTLLGPSGCGKSTLLRIIAGLETQDAGTVLLEERSVDGVRASRRDMAMVFQSYALYPHMTVAQNMSLPLRMRQLTATQRLPILGRFLSGTRDLEAEIDRTVEETAALLGLGHVLDQKPSALSGGQRQRVALGRAMVRHPSVFLMDEPLSNLDAKLRVAMRAEIKRLHQRLGATFVYVTHDQVEAMTMSDRVAVLQAGEILQVATPRDIYADPACLAVAEMLGSPKINILSARNAPETLILLAAGLVGMSVDYLQQSGASIGVRPEAWTLCDIGEVLTGRTALVEDLGADRLVHLDVPGLAEPLVIRLGAAIRPPVQGEVIRVTASAADLLVFNSDGRRCRAVGRGASNVC
jgi:multiple sugar transport system ATP-binding protein